MLFLYFNLFEKKTFFTDRPLRKLISFLHLSKGARLGGVLEELQGAGSLDIFPVHMDWDMPW
jgi:hypothetical protein